VVPVAGVAVERAVLDATGVLVDRPQRLEGARVGMVPRDPVRPERSGDWVGEGGEPWVTEYRGIASAGNAYRS